MQGFFNSALEGFLRETYGHQAWQAIVRLAEVPFDHFEPLLSYPSGLTEKLLAAASAHLRRSTDLLLESLGNWMVAPRKDGRLRRLLRFGGVNFLDFLHSLEELPERARLALPDLAFPGLTLVDLGDGDFLLQQDELFDGAHHVLIGVLRAMADDYGALVLIERADDGIRLRLLDADHAEARRFELAAEAMR